MYSKIIQNTRFKRGFDNWSVIELDKIWHWPLHWKRIYLYQVYYLHSMITQRCFSKRFFRFFSLSLYIRSFLFFLILMNTQTHHLFRLTNLIIFQCWCILLLSILKYSIFCVIAEILHTNALNIKNLLLWHNEKYAY